MNENNKFDEKELIRLVKQGGDGARDAIGKLYGMYYLYVESEASKCFYDEKDCEEFCQEVWKRVIEKLPAFTGDSLALLLGRAYRPKEQPQGIIGRCYLEFLRSKSSILQEFSVSEDRRLAKEGKVRLYSLHTPFMDKRGKTIFLKDMIADESKSPLEILIEKETQQIVREEIEKLPNIYRYVILMRYFDGRSTEDIAQLLNISIEDVWQRLSRGYEKLKELLIKRMGKNPLEEVNIYRSKKHNRRK